ncbi:MAG: MATE family efflux transporter [Spirochaetaceae bacterium]|nr:MAG: MATE family efflux transporter [Spirochaetaceae bacterium]
MPIGKLIARLAIPSSVALFVTSTYNLVDTIFVGRGVGPLAIGALALVFPLQMFVMAFGNLIGIGAASVVSRALGAGEPERARSAAGTAVTLAVGVGVFVAAVGSLFPDRLVTILGGTDDLRDLTIAYVTVILIAEPFHLFNLAATSLIRAEGEARVAMATMVAGMLVNIALDPVFIFGFGWGVQGAAAATLIGHIVTTGMIVVFYARGRGAVRLRAKDLRPARSVVRETLTIGSSGFVRQVSTSVVHGLRNNLLVLWGGTLFVSAFGVVFRSLLFLALPAMGIAQALPPIAGYNYGANRMDRVRRSVWLSIGACTLFMWIGFAIMWLFPGALFRLFSNDTDLIEIGIPIMRVNALALLTFPIYFNGPSFYQAIGKPGRALVLASARPILAAIVMLIGVRMVGPLGVVAADPIALAIGSIAVVAFLLKSFRGSGELGRGST